MTQANEIIYLTEKRRLEREANAKLRAENAALRETIKAIRAVNVDEHGQVADAAIERLIASQS